MKLNLFTISKKITKPKIWEKLARIDKTSQIKCFWINKKDYIEYFNSLDFGWKNGSPKEEIILHGFNKVKFEKQDVPCLVFRGKPVIYEEYKKFGEPLTNEISA